MVFTFLILLFQNYPVDSYNPRTDSYSLASERLLKNKPDDYSNSGTPELRSRNRHENGNPDTPAFVGLGTSV